MLYTKGPKILGTLLGCSTSNSNLKQRHLSENLKGSKTNYKANIYFYYLGLVSLFNSISIFVGYLMPKPFSEKNSSGTI